MKVKVADTVVGPEYFGKNFNPLVLSNFLESQGFVFESKGCPTIFAGHVDQFQAADGSVRYVQYMDRSGFISQSDGEK